MGEARNRGTYEQRKGAAELRKFEEELAAEQARLKREAEAEELRQLARQARPRGKSRLPEAYSAFGPRRMKKPLLGAAVTLAIIDELAFLTKDDPK